MLSACSTDLFNVIIKTLEFSKKSMLIRVVSVAQKVIRPLAKGLLQRSARRRRAGNSHSFSGPQTV